MVRFDSINSHFVNFGHVVSFCRLSSFKLGQKGDIFTLLRVFSSVSHSLS